MIDALRLSLCYKMFKVCNVRCLINCETIFNHFASFIVFCLNGEQNMRNCADEPSRHLAGEKWWVMCYNNPGARRAHPQIFSLFREIRQGELK